MNKCVKQKRMTNEKRENVFFPFLSAVYHNLWAHKAARPTCLFVHRTMSVFHNIVPFCACEQRTKWNLLNKHWWRKLLIAIHSPNALSFESTVGLYMGNFLHWPFDHVWAKNHHSEKQNECKTKNHFFGNNLPARRNFIFINFGTWNIVALKLTPLLLVLNVFKAQRLNAYFISRRLLKFQCNFLFCLQLN